MDQHHWDEVAEGRRKWDRWMDTTLNHLSEALIHQSRTCDGQSILDLGTGTGHPAIHCAEKFPNSTVWGLDISLEMLRSAKLKAAGIPNIRFVQSDAQSLPFQNGSFHSIISRFCLMFISNAEQHFQEVVRVLLPGGYWSATVWGDPLRNPLPLSILNKHIQLAPPSFDEPGQYRYWKPGCLNHIMIRAGLVPDSEKEIAFEESYSSGKEFTNRFLESSVLAAKVKQQTPAMQSAIITDLASAAETYRVGEMVKIPRFARLLTAQKPESAI